MTLSDTLKSFKVTRNIDKNRSRQWNCGGPQQGHWTKPLWKSTTSGYETLGHFTLMHLLRTEQGQKTNKPKAIWERRKKRNWSSFLFAR